MFSTKSNFNQPMNVNPRLTGIGVCADVLSSRARQQARGQQQARAQHAELRVDPA